MPTKDKGNGVLQSKKMLPEPTKVVRNQFGGGPPPGWGAHEAELSLWDYPDFRIHPISLKEEAVGGIFHRMWRDHVEIMLQMKADGWPHTDIQEVAKELWSRQQDAMDKQEDLASTARDSRHNAEKDHLSSLMGSPDLQEEPEEEPEEPKDPEVEKSMSKSKYSHINFKPPQTVRNNAARGLELRKKAPKSKKGGLSASEASKQGIGSGVQRASNLKNGSNVSPKVINQMVSFFARHEKNKGIAPGKSAHEDKGYQAWMLWGGDAGAAWARKIKRQMEAADERAKKSLMKSNDDPKTPADPSERKRGSSVNKEGSASTGTGVTLSENATKALENKVKEHNEKYPSAGKKASLRALKAVYRRGAGAFSTSHRPSVSSRDQWAMGRVNAFLHLLGKGSPKKASYVTDNDLLPEGHPKSTKSRKSLESHKSTFTIIKKGDLFKSPSFPFPKMPFPYDALEPKLDAETMRLHHKKHLRGYTDKLNDALKGSGLHGSNIEEILSRVFNKIGKVATANDIRNNGGGYVNHILYFDILKPGGSNKPKGALLNQIKKDFGSFAQLKKEMKESALSIFGAGWLFLAFTPAKRLVLYSCTNQDSPLMWSDIPILGIDVWEHAYYKKYGPDRESYVDAVMSLLNWDVIGEKYDIASGGVDSTIKKADTTGGERVPTPQQAKTLKRQSFTRKNPGVSQYAPSDIESGDMPNPEDGLIASLESEDKQEEEEL